MKRIATLLLILVSLVATGCVDPGPADTGVTVVYAFDNLTSTVMVWDDVNTIYDQGTGTAAPTPARTITGDVITNIGSLAWGGLVVNPYLNQLYLVGEGGSVVRINNARTQSGALSSTTDIISFSLGTSSTRLDDSVFGQASINTSTGILYVVETGSSNTSRIWAVSSPGSLANNAVVTGTLITPNEISGDIKCYGMSASSAGVFAYYGGGNTITNTSDLTTHSGPRLRYTTGTSFSNYDSGLLVGTDTLLALDNAYASLAFDPTYTRLYLARYVSGGNAVMVYTQSQFTSGSMDSAPTGTLPDTCAALSDLRIISHARAKDWLVGADYSSGTGTDILRIWKAPSNGTDASLEFTVPAVDSTGAARIRGIALDGSQ